MELIDQVKKVKEIENEFKALFPNVSISANFIPDENIWIFSSDTLIKKTKKFNDWLTTKIDYVVKEKLPFRFYFIYDENEIKNKIEWIEKLEPELGTMIKVNLNKVRLFLWNGVTAQEIFGNGNDVETKIYVQFNILSEQDIESIKRKIEKELNNIDGNKEFIFYRYDSKTPEIRGNFVVLINKN